MEIFCGVVFALALLVLPIVLSIVAMSRTAALRKQMQDLQGELARLRDQLRQPVATRREQPAAAYVAKEQPAATPPPPVTPPVPPPVATTPPVERPAAAPVTPEVAPPPPPQPTAPLQPAPPAPEPQVVSPEPPPRTYAPPPPRPRAAAPQPPAARAWSIDWESLVGVKLFSWIAGIALVLAAVFFLKHSVEQGWVNPPVRAAIGLITGVVLLVICEMRIARDYKFTANAMHGAGIAILYATLFATHALWHLLPATVVFLLMLLVTAVAVALSIRRDSVFIALLGLMGGFATPAMLATGENRPIGLFGYLLLLNAGLAWVAYRKRWPALTFGSLLFTFAYQWGWISKYLTAQQLVLAAIIFVIFAAAGATALFLGRGAAKQRSFDRMAIASAALPLLFAVYTAAIPAYGARYNVLFGFLILIAAGLATIALTRGPQWLHVLGGGTVVLTFAVWFGLSYAPHAYPGIVAWLAAFIMLYLIAAWRRQTFGSYTVPALFLFFPVLIASEAATAAPALVFVTMFVLLAATAFVAAKTGQGQLYYLATIFVIVAEGHWSATHLTRDRLLSGMLVHGAFALLFLGAPIVARRFGKPLQPANGAFGTIIASLLLLLFLTQSTLANAALWGLALLVLILISGALAEARVTRKPLFAMIALGLGWFVLLSWWSGAAVETMLIPTLIVTALIGLVALLGNAWAAKGTDDPTFTQGTHLALVGHLFLAFAATQPSLSLPPWPIFAVLFVLDLAIGVTALYLRRNGTPETNRTDGTQRGGSLILGGAITSQVVIIAWTSAANTPGWRNVALLATIAVAIWACVFAWLLRKMDRPLPLSAAAYAHAPIAALILGHVAVMMSGAPFATQLAAHVLLAIATFVLAWITEVHGLALVSVVVTWFATGVAGSEQPRTVWTSLYFALPFYVLAIAYPLLLGARAKRSILPHLAAVVASGAFFFYAYEALTDAGYKYMIGILPVAQAIVLLVVLMRLLRTEPAGERLLSRLALVAAASLAFITVAIPLQLDKQWITIAWALEAAALVWLFTRIPHRGLLAWAGALLAVVFVRLTLNPAVLSYHPASERPIFNWYFYTYLTCAIAFFLAAYFAREPKWGRGAASAGGTILLFCLLNIEIADFYSSGPTLAFNFLSATLAQDLTYTIGWAVFAVAMLITGIRLHARPARVAALFLLVITILKGFTHDLWRLGGLYRIGSLLGLAIALVLVGILLQKFVMPKRVIEETT
ncbi:MAG TPA: DUF2339 domain-containing protein [Thermoanaerobaculia bacterium]